MILPSFPHLLGRERKEANDTLTFTQPCVYSATVRRTRFWILTLSKSCHSKEGLLNYTLYLQLVPNLWFRSTKRTSSRTKDTVSSFRAASPSFTFHSYVVVWNHLLHEVVEVYTLPADRLLISAEDKK